MARRKAVQVARAAMSGRLAPSCWPTIVETARPMPIIGTQATLLTLKASIVPAWLIFPSPPTSVMKSVKEPHSTSHCKPPGAPKVQSRRIKAPFQRQPEARR